MDLSTLTKKQLVELAAKQDIRFKKSGNKAEIIAAIEKGERNSDPYWLTCKHTGLVFNAVELGVSFQTQVHPEIADWLKSANKNGWYNSCFEALEYCKEQDFTEIKQFNEVLNRQEVGDPIDGSSIDYDLELTGTGYQYNKYHLNSRKPWVAKITGLHAKYGYDRTFLEEVKQDNRYYWFKITEDGYYQTKEYSGKGNEYIVWYERKNGELTEVSESEIIAVFGDPEEFKAQKLTILKDREAENLEPKPIVTDLPTKKISLVYPNWRGTRANFPIGHVISFDEEIVKIVDKKVTRVEEDGMSFHLSAEEGWYYEYDVIDANPEEKDEWERGKLPSNSAKKANPKIVEECWECGTTYTTYGNLINGPMMCRRCQ